MKLFQVMLAAKLPRWKAAGAAAAAVVAAPLGGCQQGGAALTIVHSEGHGPLSAGIPKGGYGLDTADHLPWYGTFGSFVLCSAQGGSISLSDVHYVVKAAPLTTTPLLRSVPPGKATSTRAPVLARRGQPGRFESQPHGLDGHLTDHIAGATITTPCDAPPESSYTELLTVMKFGPSGGWVRETDIDYSYNGQRYTLKVPYDLVGCGNAIATGDYC